MKMSLPIVKRAKHDVDRLLKRPQKIRGEYGDWRVLTPYGLCYDFETKRQAIEFTNRHNKALEKMGEPLRYTFTGAKRGSKAWWKEKEKLEV